jgi:hypothetical protein
MVAQRLNLKARIATWPAYADCNLAELAEGWNLVEEMAELHWLALQALSATAGRRPSKQDECVLLLGGHGLNLLIGTVELIVKGQFDVASYLLRALFDCESLSYAVHAKPELADRFLADDLRSFEGRRMIIENIRSLDPDLADFLDKRYRDEFDAANDMSHVNLTQLDKLVTSDGQSITPVVGGRCDGIVARRMTGVVVEHEHWHLTWFAAFRTDTMGPDWTARYKACGESMRPWMKAVFGATGYSADADSESAQVTSDPK